MQLTFGQHQLTLLPPLAALDARRQTLFVADLHLGKTTVFNDAGLSLPGGPDDDTLSRLERVIADIKATTLVVLGDLFHARSKGMDQVLASLAAWRAKQAAVKWVVVPGNHDRRVSWPEWLPGATILGEGESLGPWRVAHHPSERFEALTLCGHLHPGISLGKHRLGKLTVPCFWHHGNSFVLPAFGGFTGLSRIRRADGDGVWIVSGDDVLPVPEKLKPAVP
jgi:DNA ligase-associated metallophosphoesterase